MNKFAQVISQKIKGPWKGPYFFAHPDLNLINMPPDAQKRPSRASKNLPMPRYTQVDKNALKTILASLGKSENPISGKSPTLQWIGFLKNKWKYFRIPEKPQLPSYHVEIIKFLGVPDKKGNAGNTLGNTLDA